MTRSIAQILESARLIAAARARARARVQAQETRHNISVVGGYNSVSQIPMHITPWWKDENGIPTRQIWAKGSIIER